MKKTIAIAIMLLLLFGFVGCKSSGPMDEVFSIKNKAEKNGMAEMSVEQTSDYFNMIATNRIHISGVVSDIVTTPSSLYPDDPDKAISTGKLTCDGVVISLVFRNKPDVENGAEIEILGDVADIAQSTVKLRRVDIITDPSQIEDSTVLAVTATELEAYIKAIGETRIKVSGIASEMKLNESTVDEKYSYTNGYVISGEKKVRIYFATVVDVEDGDEIEVLGTVQSIYQDFPLLLNAELISKAEK